MQLTNEFEPIRDWAKERGIYEKGTVKGQFTKLLEEVEELNQAILEKDKRELIDAVGDCVVVLTNLSELAGVKIEDCINIAYKVIENRKGVMKNGTFEKE